MADLPTDIETVVNRFTPEQQRSFKALREQVFELAVERTEIGPITETLKWGEPAYLTEKTKSGSTLRIAPTKAGDQLALFVNCKTNLIEQFKSHYADQFQFHGVRAMIVPTVTENNKEALKHCIALTLMYHRNKA